MFYIIRFFRVFVLLLNVLLLNFLHLIVVLYWSFVLNMVSVYNFIQCVIMIFIRDNIAHLLIAFIDGFLLHTFLLYLQYPLQQC